MLSYGQFDSTNGMISGQIMLDMSVQLFFAKQYLLKTGVYLSNLTILKF